MEIPLGPPLEKGVLVEMKKLLLLVIAISCLALCGCGGSNGIDHSGNGLNPDEQEFADIVYAFQKAVNFQNIDEAKNLILSEVIYNKSYNYSLFVGRLENFLEKAEDIHFDISGIGVDFIYEDKIAEVRAESQITYTYNNDRRTIEECFVFTINKEYQSNTGIQRFQKYNPNDGSDVISAFPPVLE